jgi:hypothetical protein
LNWNFQSRVLKKFYSSPPSLAKGWNPQDVLQEVFQAQRGYSKHHKAGSCPSVSLFVGRYSDIPCAGFATGFCKIQKLVHFAKCVQHFWNAGTGSCTLWNQ